MSFEELRGSADPAALFLVGFSFWKSSKLQFDANDLGVKNLGESLRIINTTTSILTYNLPGAKRFCIGSPNQLSGCSPSDLWVISECSLSALWGLCGCSLGGLQVPSECSLSDLIVCSECAQRVLRMYSECAQSVLWLCRSMRDWEPVYICKGHFCPYIFANGLSLHTHCHIFLQLQLYCMVRVSLKWAQSVLMLIVPRTKSPEWKSQNVPACVRIHNGASSHKEILPDQSYKSPEKLQRYASTKENMVEAYLSNNLHQSAQIKINQHQST